MKKKFFLCNMKKLLMLIGLSICVCACEKKHVCDVSFTSNETCYFELNDNMGNFGYIAAPFNRHVIWRGDAPYTLTYRKVKDQYGWSEYGEYHFIEDNCVFGSIKVSLSE